MPVPDYQSLMVPVLEVLTDDEEHSLADIRDCVAVMLRLTPEDIQETLPSGQSRFANRIGWAVTAMERAGLVERVERGIYTLTSEGERLWRWAPGHRLDLKMLREQCPRFVAWEKQARKASGKGKGDAPEQASDSTETPKEALDSAELRLRGELEADVLDRVRGASPAFLERVIVDLLIAMGYGGGDNARGLVTGRSGDGGIDGKIREDALGLDEVYVQAKRYAADNAVGEGALRNFAGAIDAQGTTKGVFVTTSSFTKAAKEYLKKSPKRIVLIDGAELARLMVRHGIGARTYERYEIKQIDEDYFEQDIPSPPPSEETSEPPMKWTASVVGWPVYKDGKMLSDDELPKGWPKWTDEQKRNIARNTDILRGAAPGPEKSKDPKE